MANLKQGSKGSEVRELQTLLNNNGANLSVDGIYGPKTAAAVKSYQKANGLTVDGIVGNNTWGSLRGTNTTQTTQPSAAVTAATETTTTPAAAQQTSPTSTTPTISGVSTEMMSQLTSSQYTPSQQVLDAMSKLQEQAGTQPSPYVSQYSDQLEDLYNQIVSRSKEPFQYDLNGDSLWQQYKDQYTNLGRRAMEDTMGNAASLTGGYGNSYASTAGNQAYQQYLTQLTNMIPELEGRAYERWRDQGEDLYNQYGLTADRENQDYGRWNDAYNRYLTDRDYLTDAYNNERNFDYGTYSDEYSRRAALASMLNSDYWQQQAMDFDREQWEWQKAQAEKAASSSGGGGGGGSKKKKSSDPTPTVKYTAPTKDVLREALTQYQVARSEKEFTDWANYMANTMYHDNTDMQRRYYAALRKYAEENGGVKW